LIFQMTRQAQELMVEYYKDLRADDAQGVGRNSYRITVRQLESMIRLSEAIARANCVEEITPAFVKEAYTLLKQSIIHVEKDDVEMEDEDEEPQVPDEPVEAQPAKKEKIKVQYDKYIKIMNLIVRRLDEDERAGGQGVERDELIMWYLEQVEDDISSEEQHQQEGELIRKVLKRLKKVIHLFAGANIRTTISWRCVVKPIWRMTRCRSMEHGKWFTFYIQIVQLRISSD
jgi:DNA replication licensing factor MCM6